MESNKLYSAELDKNLDNIYKRLYRLEKYCINLENAFLQLSRDYIELKMENNK